MERNELDGILALKLVAERRSFARAASELNISPSAVSQIVKQLETRIGIALLSRTTRSVTLTEAGERFLSQTGPAIEQILSAIAATGACAQKPSGLLRINLPKSVFWTYLQTRLAGFKEKFPDISVELFLEDAKSDVVGDGSDAGIRLSDILAKDMVASKLYGPIRFVTAASSMYLNKNGGPRHPRDLLAHDCIRGRLSRGLYDHWEFEQKGNEFSVQVKGTLILNDSLALIQSAVEGLGIIYTDENYLKDHLASGRLEIVLNQFAASSTGYYLYYPKRSQVQPKLRAFIEHLKSSN